MREPGFYWVKFNSIKWEVAEWDGVVWNILNDIYKHIDEDMERIDERQIVRDQPCKDNQFKGAKLHVWDKDGNHIGVINCDPE